MTKHSRISEGLAEPARVPAGPGRATALVLVVISVLLAGGCLVGNKEYDEARQKRDEYRSSLQRLHETNDAMKQEITEIYESCDLLSTRLTLLAALSFHDRYTANLGRPILPPPIEREREPAAAGRTGRSGRSGGSAVTTTRGQSGPRSTGGTSTRSGSGGTRASGGQRSGSSGGSRTTAPPPTPPASTGGGGSIDWGL